MLSIMTLNIWHDEANWSARRKAIRECIAKHDPDVIALQEVLKGPAFDQLQDLLEGLVPHWLFGTAKSDSRPKLRKGVALASRWPLRKVQLQRLPDAGDSEKRVALHASCDSPHGSLQLTSTHLNWRLDHGFIRCRQVQALVENIQSRTGALLYPPIVAGDFNAEPLSDEIRFMTGLHVLDDKSTHFRDAWRMVHGSADGYTWSNENDHARRALEPERRLDYVFVAPPINGRGHVLNCKRVCNQQVDGIWPSDHFGVYAELAT